MMATQKISAREIVRYAKRNKLTLARQATGYDSRCCALSVVMHMFYGDKEVNGRIVWFLHQYPEAETKLGLTSDQQYSLEAGFETAVGPTGELNGWVTPEEYQHKMTNDRYFRMGRRVTELAGLKL